MGAADVNLMQRAYYNGHYKYHGERFSMCCKQSVWHTALPAPFVVTGKAYGRTAHFQPLHTEAELRMMGPEERIRALDFDKWHKKPCLSVEDSFGQQVTKFPHTEYKYNRITQNGRSTWN